MFSEPQLDGRMVLNHYGPRRQYSTPGLYPVTDSCFTQNIREQRKMEDEEQREAARRVESAGEMPAYDGWAEVVGAVLVPLLWDGQGTDRHMVAPKQDCPAPWHDQRGPIPSLERSAPAACRLDPQRCCVWTRQRDDFRRTGTPRRPK
ncbi:hypothetical protein DPEC_G00241700 [Dallia pectoralis]|uniref:Uncharacterized protein n=1 Tax=Dallia pectoralis TaxID=75939 RepID=A0ACC2FV37_DALPE|nr:hypothetical protein DPEC_G00241700 [Dallia pectoralis]